MRVLAINPGSTSTKIAYYVDGEIREEVNFNHTNEELQHFHKAVEQLYFREQLILDFLKEKQIDVAALDAVVGRGGILPPVSAGAYQVNEAMKHFLTEVTEVDHPSNLGALLADGICQETLNGLAMIYDPVSVDEYQDISRISGLKGIERKSLGHALNMRAVAMKVARDLGLAYEKSNLIVAHLGGGNSVSLHVNGKMIDSISDDEGPFSTERTGGLPLKGIINLSESYSKQELLRLYKREGGLKSYAGTSDAREVEARIAEGDQELKIVYEAFIYQIAKGIASLAVATNGNIDAIVLTGGIAYSDYVVSRLTERIQFLAPIRVVPGGHEMIALCKGGERVVEGAEEIHQFIIKEGVYQ